MKKNYMKPQAEVTELNIKTQLMAGSGQSVYGNHRASGGSQLSREYDVNDDWDEEEEYDSDAM